MIFLKDLNLLFLKPRKVAGTSFEIILSKFASANDIITPITLEDEETRQKMGFRGPQNYKKSINRFTVRDTYQLFWHRHYPENFYNHIKASDAKDRLGSDIFEKAFKISIVRNPFDMLVSQYHWSIRNCDIPPNFKDWLRENRQVLNVNDEQYLINGEEIIDFYIRYENLRNDIAELEKRFPKLKGASQLISEVYAKGNVRHKARSVREYYEMDEDLICSVRLSNRNLIEKFGYDIE